ncbi:YdhK family protein [Virgibacillus dokdonensis]|uniref:YdhK family protein n=1 Tax=Virgibacillus dokdonensis TaxID=302167 RepID=A0ABU7VL10_9BACI
MNMKKWMFSLMVILFATVLAACGTDQENEQDKENADTNQQQEEKNQENDSNDTEDKDMKHSSSGEVPDGLKEVENPKFPVDSKAIIEASHMEGMKGAEATIKGAYDTTIYSVTYTPTDGGEKVKNHKWVIHEELKDVGEEPLKPGDEVTIQASHMKDMDGATATIDSVEQTTVYMVDYTSTTTDEEVTNHKWVTEDELSSVEK